MSTKQVSYLTKTRLSCGCIYGAGVILSCANSLTIPNSEGVAPHYIDATILSERKVSNNVFGDGWGYVFSYNDSQIKDGQTFVSGSITAVTCKSGLTQWVTDQVLLNLDNTTVNLVLTATTILPAVVTAFADINVTYDPTGFVDSAQMIREFTIVNNTNQLIWVSINGTDDFISVEPYEEETISFGRNYEFLATTNVWIRSAVVVPVVGNVTLYGWY